MSEIKDGLYYTKHDEWVAVDGEIATVGITDYAQDALSDIVYLELPEAGESFKAEDEFGVVESVKAASDLYMPLGGEVVEMHEALLDEPENINTTPYEAWMIKIKIADAAELKNLMDAAAYEAYCDERE